MYYKQRIDKYSTLFIDTNTSNNDTLYFKDYDLFLTFRYMKFDKKAFLSAIVKRMVCKNTSLIGYYIDTLFVNREMRLYFYVYLPESCNDKKNELQHGGIYSVRIFQNKLFHVAGDSLINPFETHFNRIH
jgi:CRISPR/Cas system-associated protein Cas7 (RAMP superfamily)